MQGLRRGSACAMVAQQDLHNVHFSARALFAQPELAHDRACRRWAPVVLGASSPMEGGCCAAVAAAAAAMATTTAVALGPVGPCRRPVGPCRRYLINLALQHLEASKGAVREGVSDSMHTRGLGDWRTEHRPRNLNSLLHRSIAQQVSP